MKHNVTSLTPILVTDGWQPIRLFMLIHILITFFLDIFYHFDEGATFYTVQLVVCEAAHHFKLRGVSVLNPYFFPRFFDYLFFQRSIDILVVHLGAFRLMSWYRIALFEFWFESFGCLLMNWLQIRIIVEMHGARVLISGCVLIVVILLTSVPRLSWLRLSILHL